MLDAEPGKDRAHPMTISIDEVVPVARGGKRVWENQVAACRRCNSAKGDRNAYVFAETMRAHLADGVPLPPEIRWVRDRRMPLPFVAEVVELTPARADYFRLMYGVEIAAASNAGSAGGSRPADSVIGDGARNMRAGENAL